MLEASPFSDGLNYALGAGLGYAIAFAVFAVIAYAVYRYIKYLIAKRAKAIAMAPVNATVGAARGAKSVARGTAKIGTNAWRSGSSLFKKVLKKRTPSAEPE